MERVRSRYIAKMLIVLLIIGAALSVFLFLGPPKLLAKSESPDFCGGCHVMEQQYEAWSHTGAHRRIKCVDCHLPNDNSAIHYAWKAIDGFKDVGMFYTGMVPEQIELTKHGAKVLQANCVRCHASTVAMINQDRTCWDCHRRLMHTRSGTMETL
jgi:cytochrome c nitrite reductase small subunit